MVLNVHNRINRHIQLFCFLFQTKIFVFFEFNEKNNKKTLTNLYEIRIIYKMVRKLTKFIG